MQPLSRRPHVVIAGGGIAGVEALLALRELAGQRISLELIAPEPDLVYRPFAVAEPFGIEETRRFRLDDICADCDAHQRPNALTFVDVAAGRVETDGPTVDYDALVVAIGARRREWLPGAVTFGGPESVGAFQNVLSDLMSGRARSVVFALPPGATWALPLYELALMTARLFGAADRADVHVTLVTPERDPLEIFGRATRNRVRALLSGWGVELRATSQPLQLVPGILLTSTEALPADRVVVLPEIEGPRVPGLPSDDHGFLPIDGHAAVRGAANVYAAGDGTDSPIKQGGLGSQQADAAAEAIAAAMGAPCRPEPVRADLCAQLLTGAEPLYLRARQGGAAHAAYAPMWWPAGKVAARYLGPYLAEKGLPALA